MMFTVSNGNDASQSLIVRRSVPARRKFTIHREIPAGVSRLEGMTDITTIKFDEDGSNLTVTLRDGHTFTAVSKLDIQEHGLMYEETQDTPNHRLFIPWSFVQSIDQPI